MCSPSSRWHGDCFLPRLTLLLPLFLCCICCGVGALPGRQPPPWCPLTPRSSRPAVSWCPWAGGSVQKQMLWVEGRGHTGLGRGTGSSPELECEVWGHI